MCLCAIFFFLVSSVFFIYCVFIYVFDVFLSWSSDFFEFSAVFSFVFIIWQCNKCIDCVLCYMDLLDRDTASICEMFQYLMWCLCANLNMATRYKTIPRAHTTNVHQFTSEAIQCIWKSNVTHRFVCVWVSTKSMKKKSKFKTVSKNPLEVPCYLLFSHFICVWMQVIVFICVCFFSSFNRFHTRSKLWFWFNVAAAAAGANLVILY